MKLFDPHIHMTSRTTADYEAMAQAGIAAIVEPSFWLGQPRTHVGTFEDYFNGLLGWERFRASQFGVHHFCTLSLNPKEANNRRVAPGVIELLPRYLAKDGVVAVGEIGFDDQTPEEEKYFAAQLELALRFDLPVLIHTPHRDKKRGTERSLALVRDVGFPEGRVLIDHNTEETLPLVRETGCWAGHSIYPFTKMDEPRMVALVKRYGTERILINSAADWGVSDPLKVPKTVALMRESGIPEADVRRVAWDNPVAFFAQSGQLDPAALEAEPAIDQSQLFEGNSVLRGQAPRVSGAPGRAGQPGDCPGRRAGGTAGAPPIARRAPDGRPPRRRADRGARRRGDPEPGRPRPRGRLPSPPDDPAGGHLLRAVHARHRAPAQRPRRGRQRLVLPRPVGGLALAAVEPPGRRGEGLGSGPPARSRVHVRQALLVVQHAQRGDLVGDAAPHVPRRRAEDPRRLHAAG
jgi:hypothetical protein